MNYKKYSLQKYRKSRKYLWLLGLVFWTLGSLTCSRPQDYILVIDTSGSMSVGERVIEKIKANIGDFIDDLDEGETITLMGFDSNPRFYRTYKIQKDADRQRPARKVRSFKAHGAYTDMDAMLGSVSRVSKKLQVPGRQVVLVVMSDGKDDPPPWKKRKNLRLEALEKSSWFWGLWEEPYIYYVSLGKLHDDKLRKNLTRLAPRVRRIKDSKTAGLQEVSADIEGELFSRTTLVVLSSILLAALLALAVRWFFTRHKLSGVLEYYDADVGPSLKESFRLTKLRAHRFALGPKSGAQLKIRDFSHRQNLTLRTRSYKNLPCLKPRKKEIELFNFKRSRFKNKALISPGDQFEVGNYVFEYK